MKGITLNISVDEIGVTHMIKFSILEWKGEGLDVFSYGDILP